MLSKWAFVPQTSLNITAHWMVSKLTQLSEPEHLLDNVLRSLSRKLVMLRLSRHALIASPSSDSLSPSPLLQDKCCGCSWEGSMLPEHTAETASFLLGQPTCILCPIPSHLHTLPHPGVGVRFPPRIPGWKGLSAYRRDVSRSLVQLPLVHSP